MNPSVRWKLFVLMEGVSLYPSNSESSARKERSSSNTQRHTCTRKMALLKKDGEQLSRWKIHCSSIADFRWTSGRRPWIPQTTYETDCQRRARRGNLSQMKRGPRNNKTSAISGCLEASQASRFQKKNAISLTSKRTGMGYSSDTSPTPSSISTSRHQKQGNCWLPPTRTLMNQSKEPNYWLSILSSRTLNASYLSANQSLADDQEKPYLKPQLTPQSTQPTTTLLKPPL